MTGPITPERRAEIRDIAARYRWRAYVGLAGMARGIDELDAEIDRLTRQLAGLKTVWSSIYSDGEYDTKDEALAAATKDRFGTTAVEEDACWRVVGDWSSTTIDTKEQQP